MISTYIQERFDEAIDMMYEHNFNLATEITKLGYPRLTKNCPTACVSWDNKNRQIVFEFNEDFIKTLSDEEFMFICAHETMHILNSHVFMIAREVKKLKAIPKDVNKNNKNETIGEFLQKFNVAADCVVNDSIVHLYNVPKMLEETAIYGKNTVGIDCEGLSVWDVYRLLPELKKIIVKIGKIDVHDWDSFFDKDGNVNGDFVKKLKGVLEDNEENSAMSDKELEQISKSLKELAQNSGTQAGTKSCGRFRPITRDSRNIANWDKLLFQFIESNKIEDKWNRPNRKLYSFYPDIILPKTYEKEIIDLFIAVDASGSISYEALSLFVNVVKTTPKNFKVKVISFDTKCYEYDIVSDERPMGGGGTDFKIIENYVRTKLKRYPNVIVLTDGHGTPVNPKHKEKWIWLLYGYSSDMFCKGMKSYNLGDLLR